MDYTRLKIYIEDKEYNNLYSAAEDLNCTVFSLKRMMTKADYKSEDSFVFNNKTVSFVDKSSFVYVKYVLNDIITLYLLYIIRSNGKIELMRTLTEDHFNNLKIDTDKYKVYDSALFNSSDIIENALLTNSLNNGQDS
jgi:hypothetical protein